MIYKKADIFCKHMKFSEHDKSLDAFIKRALGERWPKKKERQVSKEEHVKNLKEKYDV